MKTLKFERLSLDEGLSQSTVYSLIQDKKGFIWAGTEEGLNRFDGNHFKVYKNILGDEKSIANNLVKKIYQDNDGTLWIGTLDGFFMKYDNNSDNFTNFSFDTIEHSSKAELTSIVEDSESNLWVGSYFRGLKIFDKSKNCFEDHLTQFGSINNHFSSDICTIYNDPQGLLWIGTWDKGLFIFDPKNNLLFHHEIISTLSPNHNNVCVRCIYQDRNLSTWIGTKEGLYLFDPNTKNVRKFTLNSSGSEMNSWQINSICEDKNKTVWIGTQKGLIEFKNESMINVYQHDKHDMNSLSSDNIYTLFVDCTNVLWMGTSGGGINKLDCEFKKFYSLTKLIDENDEVPLKKILSFYIDSSHLWWVSSYDKKLFVIDNFKLHKFNEGNISDAELLTSMLTDIVEDKNSDIWFSFLANNFIIKYCREQNEFKKYILTDNSGVNTLKIYNNELLIATRENGIICFCLSNEKFKPFSENTEFLNKIKKGMVFSIFIDSEKLLWLGTVTEGLFQYDVKSQNYINYKFDKDDNNSISDNCILCINQDKEGNILVGTNKGGLNYLYKNEKRFKRITIDQGLSNNMIKGILEDERKNLWLSSNNGLSQIDINNFRIKNFYKNDGLQSNEFNDRTYFKDRDGTMYFGGINGITYFKPEEIKDNPYIPNIVITDFQIFNESVISSPENFFLKTNITFAKEITLSHRESVFSFEFSALCFNNLQKNQYAYIMEGFDKDWIYCGTRRQATYTNLDPGIYTFRVKGSNNDGIWNEDGTSIKITITPPYWKTWWFKGLGALSFAAATGYSYKQRLNKMEKEKKDQEEFSRKLIGSQETERKRIALELHDTIAHDILISKNKALMALKHPNDNDRLKNSLTEISEMATLALNDVRSIAYNLHPHQLERLGFTKAIRSIVNDVIKATNINFTVEIDNVDEVISKESEINLFRIIQEAISNIIKHSGASEAHLSVKRLDDYIIAMIFDNGKGFNVSRKKSSETKEGIGLQGIAERAKFMGDYRIESELNKGTTLRIRIPLNIK